MAEKASFVSTDDPCEGIASLFIPSSGEDHVTAKRSCIGRSLSVVLFVVLLWGVSDGRPALQGSVPIFQTSAELVSVQVTVKDRHGTRVHGLTKNDFHIFEDGHEVSIRSFTNAPMQPASTISSGGPAPVEASLPQEIAAIPIILFFDQLNTPSNEQAEVRHRLATWYENQRTLAAPTCVILYTGWALRLLQQPTKEAAKIRTAIESIPTTVNMQGAGATGELPLPSGANENLAIGTGDGPLRTITRLDYFWHRATASSDTQSALTYAGRLFAAWPGEKALVWLSAGTTIKPDTSLLQVLQVKLYPLNLHAHLPYEFIASFTTPLTTYTYETEVNSELLQNMREAAQETGGELCSDSLQPQSCVQKALEDATDHYLLSYETHARSTQPEWRQIRVKVDRPGVTVYARNGVMITPSLEGSVQKREQIDSALDSPVDLPGLRLELQPVPPHRPGQQILLSLLMRRDPNHPAVWNSDGTDFTVAGIVLSGADVVQRFAEDIHGSLPRQTIAKLDVSGLTWAYKIAMPKNATAVRLVVRDNTTGRMGSVTRSLP